MIRLLRTVQRSFERPSILHLWFGLLALAATQLACRGIDFNDSFLPSVAPSQAGSGGTDLAGGAAVWTTERWTSIEDTAMTTSFCQQLFDVLASDEYFMAYRVPATAASTLDQSAPLPIHGNPMSHTIRIQEFSPFTTVFTAAVELRPERSTFMANNLPQASGETWVALGVDGPVTCPQAMNIPSGDWSTITRVVLDLSEEPNNCDGCILTYYDCWEGEQPPPLPGAPTGLAGVLGFKGLDALSEAAGTTSFRGDGITCLGPRLVNLDNPGSPDWWYLEGSISVPVTPTHPVTFSHIIYNTGLVTYTVQTSSTLGVTWGVYAGSGGGPDLTQPLTGPISVTNLAQIWFVSEPVPADTPDGPYSLLITVSRVSNPADRKQTTDVMWVGDWVAPPAGLWRVFLPMINR